MSKHRLTKGSVRRSLAIGAAGAMFLTVLPGAAFAQSRGTQDVCPPPGETATDQFPDDGNNVHEDNIDCVAQYDIAQGFQDGTYGPTLDVTRAQMATYIANMVRTAGAELPAGTDAFPDDDGTVHENNINAIAAAGIVSGFQDGTYRPGLSVTRDQMATYIANAIDYVDDQQVDGSIPPEPTADYFVDDEGNVHENNINRLAEQNIVAGTNVSERLYAPKVDVSRAQMATFIMQGADYLAELGLWAPFAQVTVTGVPAETTQGEQVTATVQVPEGTTVQSVRVLGCGVDETRTTDADAGTANFQVQFTVPADQAEGECVIRFIVTDQNDNVLEERVTTTVVAPAAAQTVTERPELQFVELVSRSGSTVVARYTFDELVDANVTATESAPGNFKLYRADASSVAGSVADVQDDSVLVEFGMASSTDFENVTTATVVEGAVTDRQFLENPEGDYPLQETTSTQAGGTLAPDLVSVGNFRSPGGLSPTTTLVDFVFDEDATITANTAGYQLVLTDGTTDIECTFASGDNTDTHTVSCPIAGNDNQQIAASDVARGYVERATVTDGTNSNPLQAADVSGVSATPDLVSVSFDETNDRVTYTFDEEVSVNNAGLFRAYGSDGDDLTPTPTGAQVSSTDARVVTAQFGTGTVGNFVGASVEEGAVRERFGEQRLNQEDEERRDTSGTTAFPAGRTAAPDLVDVSAPTTTATNLQGEAIEFTVTFTFDEEVTAVGAPSLYKLWTVNDANDPILADGCVLDADDSTQVNCTYDASTNTEFNRVQDAVLGTVAQGAASDADGANPEGAEII